MTNNLPPLFTAFGNLLFHVFAIRLLPAENQQLEWNRKSKPKQSEYSSSVIAFYLCSNKRWPQLSHHTVFLSTDWKGSWDSAFGKLPGGELGDRWGLIYQQYGRHKDAVSYCCRRFWVLCEGQDRAGASPPHCPMYS